MTTMRHDIVDMRVLRSKHAFASLLRTHTGLMETVSFLPQELGTPVFEVAAASLGNLTMTFPHITDRNGKDVRDRRIGGAGADLDPEMAWLRAVIEGAERYASMVHSPEDFVIATAHDLGHQALDLDTVPRCSANEYTDPKCPLEPASKDAPIRWIAGHSLVTGKMVYVPAVMTHLYLPARPGERFWLPISTGVAAHTDLAAALTSAICESIERDAIATTWLARIPLTKIDPVSLASSDLIATLSRLNGSRVKQVFFDATTDLEIPTILSIQECIGHLGCSLFVSCATSLDPYNACAKTVREAAPARNVMTQDRPLPKLVEDFTELTHGADYYGSGQHTRDFDFLLKELRHTSIDSVGRGAETTMSSADSLRHLISRLRVAGMEAIAIDLTTDELRDVGLWVVRVVIPQLMPISFVHRARYLGTPRLYEYARYRGLEKFTAASVNPGPMPFA